MSDRTGGRRFRKLLDDVWTGCNITSDPDRRSGCYYDRGGICNAFREKDFADAEKRYAERNFSTAGGRYRKNDPFYPGWDISDRNNRSSGYDAIVLQQIWNAWNLDGSISLDICVL